MRKELCYRCRRLRKYTEMNIGLCDTCREKEKEDKKKNMKQNATTKL
jgi:hypothetical protein